MNCRVTLALCLLLSALSVHAAKCTYALSPGSAACSYTGTNGSLTLNVEAGCAWTAASTNSWIHTSSTGSGPGPILYSVDPQAAYSARVGVITAGDKTCLITQSGMPTPLEIALGNTNLLWETGTDYPWRGTNPPAPSFSGTGSAMSGNRFVPNSTSWLQTTVVGPGTLTFWWKVDSDVYPLPPLDPESFDALEFDLNGVMQDQIMGQVDWKFRTYAIPEGTNILRWQYVKDSAYNSGWDQAWLDTVTYTTNPPIALYQAVNTCGAEWTSGGNNYVTYWTGQGEVSQDGVSAGRSGPVGFGQQSWLESTVSGITNLSFWWKVSSRTNNDYLEFYTNSVLARRISGEVDWQSNYFKVSAASQVLRWRFVRAAVTGTSPVENCGWLDQVSFSPPLPPAVVSYQTNLTLSLTAGNCSAVLPDLTGPENLVLADTCGSLTVSQLPPAGTVLTPGPVQVVLTVSNPQGSAAWLTNSALVADTTGPQIVIFGANPLTNECHTPLADPGASAADDCSALLSLVTNSTVNPDQVGVYEVAYVATDTAGNSSTNPRVVYVRDTLPPIVTLIGADPIQVECHQSFADPGATASDACAGLLPVITTGAVNANSPGTYLLTYTATDGYNTGSVSRTVHVVDTTPPEVVSSFGTLTVTTDPANCTATLPDVTGPTYLTATDICGTVTVAQLPAPGTIVPLGTNAVSLTIFDNSGNSTFLTNQVVVRDAAAPALLLLGSNPLTNECHAPFVDPGATASDNCSGVVSLTTNGTVNPNQVGVYAVAYVATDTAGNSSTNTRTVYVHDTQPPIVTLVGADPIQAECHQPFADPGATASDACAGSLPVITTGAVNANSPGTYLLTYTATDGYNTGSVSRTVHVVDTTPPEVVSSFGILTVTTDPANCTATLPDVTGPTYLTATDICGTLTVTQLPVPGTIVSLGTNAVSLTISDNSGNSTFLTNQVVIRDATAPALLLIGSSPMTNECHAAFIDPGATATDNCSGLVSLTTNSTVNPKQVGVYAVSYVGTDTAGNSSTNTRTVYVHDTQPPIVALVGADPIQVECHQPFADPGATASDACAGSLPVITTGAVNANSPGTYLLIYTATDGYNTGSVSRTVHVVDTTPPQVVSSFGTLNLTAGSASCTTFLPDVTGPVYLTATDVCGSVTITQLPIAGTTLPLGANSVVLSLSDPSGNLTQITNSVVVVDPLPIISLPPGSSTNRVGETLEFSVLAQACSPLAYQWHFQGQPLAGQSTSALSIGRVESCDAGDYFVAVTGTAGTVTSAVAVLTVINAPERIDPGGSQTVGALAECGTLVLASDALYSWELDDPTGEPGVGWDLVTASGPIDLRAEAASPFRLKLISLPAGAGAMEHFDPAASYTWTIVEGAGGLLNFDPARVALDTTEFTVPFSGSFSVGTNATGLMLAYTGRLVRPEITGQALLDGTFQFTVSGPSGQACRVLATSDLSVPLENWLVLTNSRFGPTGGVFIDIDSTNFLRRFYRAVSP